MGRASALCTKWSEDVSVPVPRAAFLIAAVGLVTFGVVFSLLEFSPSRAAPSASIVAPSPTSSTQLAPDSVTAELPRGYAAVGMPTSGSSAEFLLQDVQIGDRVDVLASLPAEGAQPLTAVAVRGAKVLRTPTASDPLLLQVREAEAIVLAHLILGGTHLGYNVWSASGVPPSEPPPLDERTARALLGLTDPTPVSPVQVPAPTATPAPVPKAGPGSGFLYQAQPGDTWDGIAAIFGISVGQLRQWNEAGGDADPVPGRLVFIPRLS